MAGPYSVLVVDDDATIRDMVREGLGDEGYRVVVAADEAQAVVALARGREHRR